MKFLETFIKSLSGSIGGVVASHNRYGPYFRGRTIPVNPSSSRQQEVRSIFQSLSWDWSNVLTEVQRAAWRMYGGSVAMTDSLGQTFYLSGFCHFIRTNTIALLGGVTQVNDGPTTFTLGESDPTMVGTVDEAGQEISVAFDDGKAWLDEDGGLMQISMSRPASPGVLWIPPVNRVAGYILGGSITPPTTPSVFSVPFAVTEGQKVNVTGRILRADGRLSGQFRESTTVTA